SRASVRLIAYLYISCSFSSFSFFIKSTASAWIYTLSLHDALPILPRVGASTAGRFMQSCDKTRKAKTLPRKKPQAALVAQSGTRSEEHTSELQSRENLVCRLLLEKKNKTQERECHHAIKTLIKVTM